MNAQQGSKMLVTRITLLDASRLLLTYEDGSTRQLECDSTSEHPYQCIQFNNLNGLKRFLQAGIAISPSMRRGLQVNYELILRFVQTVDQFRIVCDYIPVEYLSDVLKYGLFDISLRRPSMQDEIKAKCFHILIRDYLPKWGINLTQVYTQVISILNHTPGQITILSAGIVGWYRSEYISKMPKLIQAFVEDCKGLMDSLEWDNLIVGCYDPAETDHNPDIPLKQYLIREWSKYQFEHVQLPISVLKVLDDRPEMDLRIDNKWLRTKVYNHPNLSDFPRLVWLVNSDYAIHLVTKQFTTTATGLPLEVVEHCILPYLL